MEPPLALVAQAFGYGVDERGEVVVQAALDLGHPSGGRHVRRRPDPGGQRGGDRAQLGPRVDGGELDVEPELELALVRPDPRHGRSGVARDHRRKCSDVSGGHPLQIGTNSAQTRALRPVTICSIPWVGGG